MENVKKDDLTSMFDEIDLVLSKTKVENITAESSENRDLPKGYFLFEVVKGELGISKSSGNPQAILQLKVVEDGYDEEIDEETNEYIRLKGTKNRNTWKYYPLTEEKIDRFISDMLKFEGDKPGEPLLEKDYFINSELLQEALSCLEGRRIYGKVSEFKTKEGTTSTIVNLITWKRAEMLELPIE